MNTIFDKFHEKEKAALARALQGLTQQELPRLRQPQRKSGHEGIYWHSKRRRWVAQMKVGGKKRYLGASKDLAEAVKMKNAAQKEYFSQ